MKNSEEYTPYQLISAAVREELCFRGILLLMAGEGPSFSLCVISSLIFALLHGKNRDLKKVLWAFGWGMVLSVITVNSGSLLYAIGLHILNNVLAARLEEPQLQLYIDPGTGAMLFTVLVGIISAGYSSVISFASKISVKLGGKGRVEKEKTPFVIFSDNKRYFNVFEPICRQLQKRGREVRYLTASEDDPVFKSDLANVKAEYIGQGNRMFARLNNLNAEILLSTTPGLEVYQWKRSPRVSWYVHIPHAASEIVLYRMFGIDYYDAVLLSGQYQADDIRALEALRHLPPKELKLVGIPYMDEMAARLEREGPAEEHPFTVLLAPSWGKSAIFAVYGGKIIESLLATGYHVIIRPHPQSFQSEKEMIEGLMARYPESEQLEWNRDVDNFEVLRRSDIMISDFSGVIFDYTLIFDRPVIYTDPDFDLAPYDAWWLNRELWTVSALKRMGVQLTGEGMENIGSVIEECLNDPRYKEGRRQVKAETWAHVSHGAELTVDYLINKYTELTGKEEGK